MTQKQRLKAVHQLYLQREGVPTAGDRWFSLYMILFLAGWYVLPIAYVIGGFLEADLAQAVTSTELQSSIAAAGCLVAVATLWFGRLHGPAQMTPFLAHMLLGSDLDRYRVLKGPTLKSLLNIAVVGCAAVSVAAFSLTHAGAWEWSWFLPLMTGVFFTALQWGLLAFLGQRLRTLWLCGITCLLLVLSAAHLLLPGILRLTPAGHLALLWTAPGISAAALGSLVFLAVMSTCGVILLFSIPRGLRNMPADRILQQSKRLADARLFISVGSVNDVVELYRSAPTRRLKYRAVSDRRSHLLAGLQRDAVAAFRTPQGLIGSAALIVIGSAMLTVATGVVGEDYADSQLLLMVPLSTLGTVLLFWGTAAPAEGWRQLKNEFDAAALYGWSAWAALRRRLLWPVLLTSVLTLSTSALINVLFMTSAGQVWTSHSWVLALALVTLCARFFQSMRPRDIPVELLAPRVAPGGRDLSAVNILLWLGDGILVSLTAVLAAIILPWGAGALSALLGGLALLALGWGWMRTGHNLFSGSPLKNRQ